MLRDIELEKPLFPVCSDTAVVSEYLETAVINSSYLMLPSPGQPGESASEQSAVLNFHVVPGKYFSPSHLVPIRSSSLLADMPADNIQGDHLSGNLEMSGNLTAVREMSGILLKVREMSGKSDLKLFIVSCTFASILDFAEFEHFILVSDHALLHSYH